MESTFWAQLAAGGHRVPEGRPLSDLTIELTAMLGDPDAHVRDHIAYATLAAWLAEGVYDDLLVGLGDGMTTGLAVGLGEDKTDSVFRRSFSSLVLAACIERDNKQHLLSSEVVLRWAERMMSWYVRERDLRGYVPGKGWAHAVAHGADALGALAANEAMGAFELTVCLDVVADRLLAPTDYRLLHGEDDRLASATMRVLRRDLLDLDAVDPWLTRLIEGGLWQAGEGDPYRVTGNVSAYLRALYLQLALAANPPQNRADLLLALIGGLRELNPGTLG